MTSPREGSRLVMDLAAELRPHLPPGFERGSREYCAALHVLDAHMSTRMLSDVVGHLLGDPAAVVNNDIATTYELNRPSPEEIASARSHLREFILAYDRDEAR